MTELRENDYIKILKFYKKSIPKTYRLLKLQAENIIANKLCRCIKKVDKKNESRSIGICTETIINNKGYTRGKFKCRKKTSIQLKKNTNNKTKRRKLL